MLVNGRSETCIFSLTSSPHYTLSITTLRKTTSSSCLPSTNNWLFFTGATLQSPVTGSRSMLVSRGMRGPTLQLDSHVRGHKSLTILRSISSIKTAVNRAVMKATRSLFDTAVEKEFQSTSWYAMATRREPLLLPPRLTPGVATRVTRLRLGHLCSTQIRQTEPEPCPHCLVEEEEDPLHHYLLRCPATHVLRPRGAWTQGIESDQAACVVAATTLSILIKVCKLQCIRRRVESKLPTYNIDRL